MNQNCHSHSSSVRDVCSTPCKHPPGFFHHSKRKGRVLFFLTATRHIIFHFFVCLLNALRLPLVLFGRSPLPVSGAFRSMFLQHTAKGPCMEQLEHFFPFAGHHGFREKCPAFPKLKHVFADYRLSYPPFVRHNRHVLHLLSRRFRILVFSKTYAKVMFLVSNSFSFNSMLGSFSIN